MNVYEIFSRESAGGRWYPLGYTTVISSMCPTTTGRPPPPPVIGAPRAAALRRTSRPPPAPPPSRPVEARRGAFPAVCCATVRHVGTIIPAGVLVAERGCGLVGLSSSGGWREENARSRNAYEETQRLDANERAAAGCSAARRRCPPLAEPTRRRRRSHTSLNYILAFRGEIAST